MLKKAGTIIVLIAITCASSGCAPLIGIALTAAAGYGAYMATHHK